MKKNRIPIIAANWKMHKTIDQMKEFIREFSPFIEKDREKEIIIAPSFICLPEFVKSIENSPIRSCAQNMYFEDYGAFTGEISPIMLKEIGVEYVILGHSERRHIFFESDEMIKRKVYAAVSHGIKPILCIGETLEERENGQTVEVLKRQLGEGVALINEQDAFSLTVAYEPVWAIGTGKTASLDQIQDAHTNIRNELKTIFSETVATEVRILYGGSVKPENASQILNLDDVDGALVGGASLDVDKFVKIVNYN